MVQCALLDLILFAPVSEVSCGEFLRQKIVSIESRNSGEKLNQLHSMLDH